jgi:hypothetical protein
MPELSVLQVGPKRNTTFVMSDYTLGQRHYANGELIDACANTEQVRGFRAALNVDADAGTGFWLRSRQHVDVDEPDYRYVRTM